LAVGAISSDASIDTNHSLAEAAKLVPKGVICLTSALAFHELTDTIPARVWMAIGAKDRLPRVHHPPLQFVRFGQKVLTTGIEEHLIEGVRVRIYSPAKTVVDLFRYRRSAGKRASSPSIFCSRATYLSGYSTASARLRIDNLFFLKSRNR